MKAEYLVAPGTDVSGIRLRFDGDVRIENDGALRIPGALGDFLEDKLASLSINSWRVSLEVAGGFWKFR